MPQQWGRLIDSSQITTVSDGRVPPKAQGLYARTQPLPDSGSSILPYCSDPNQAGRIWAFGNSTLKIGYTDDHGATFMPVIVSPTPASTIQNILITANWMFVCLSAGTSKSGQVWRSPAPNGTGSNLAFTKIFDLTGLVNGPAGAVASSNSNMSFRNSCMALSADETTMYLLTYGGGNDSLSLGAFNDGIMSAGSDILYSPGSSGNLTGAATGATLTVAGAGASAGLLTTTILEVYSNKKCKLLDSAQTSVSAAACTLPAQTFGSQNCIGGPALYRSDNANTATAASVLFVKSYQSWQWARHGHAVKIIGGVPWVSLGDSPFPSGQFGYPQTTHAGLWAATSTAGTSWNAKWLTGWTTPFAGINFMPITVGGVAMVVLEPDTQWRQGPIFVPDQTNSATRHNALAPSRTSLPLQGTGRCLTITPEGNILMLVTGESGAIGPVDAIVLLAPPFDSITVLETFALGTLGVIQDSVPDGNFVWFGTHRLTREKFFGQ